MAHTRFNFRLDLERRRNGDHVPVHDDQGEVQPTLAELNRNWGRGEKDRLDRSATLTTECNSTVEDCEGREHKMCYSLRFSPLILLALLATPAWAGATAQQYRPDASQEEIQRPGVIVDPSGKNLPAGKGTAKEGGSYTPSSARHATGNRGSGWPTVWSWQPRQPHRECTRIRTGTRSALWGYATTVWD